MRQKSFALEKEHKWHFPWLKYLTILEKMKAFVMMGIKNA